MAPRDEVLSYEEIARLVRVLSRWASTRFG